MLHCGKPLYNSVLWANWGPALSNVVILGNRFTSYQERWGLLFSHTVIPPVSKLPRDQKKCQSTYEIMWLMYQNTVCGWLITVIAYGRRRPTEDVL